MKKMRRVITAFLLHAVCLASNAEVGLVEWPESEAAGPVTVFFPTDAAEQDVKRGEVSLRVAVDAAPIKGNGALVVISHGSSASPWVYLDIARALVRAGFVVALPEHYQDNDKNGWEPGPASWKRRPLEVSKAIDAVSKNPTFSPLLQFDRVGMYGMSAGGHTALSLAGGRWSPARFKQHCQANMVEDFQTCVGLITRLTNGPLDGMKVAVASWVIGLRFSDETWYEHSDPRIKAVVAGVPLAADFDLASLSHPKVKLGIISVQKDRWLIPKFHSDAVLKACRSCESLVHLENAGHGALLSPLPHNLSGLAEDLISDPPGFNRAQTTRTVNDLIVGFLIKNLEVAR
ncbi:dienelactone hydrolase [Aquabacterium sp.]|uniref:alpha/beta hydrolase family protein n=1 Tax=Aquabacterium sp. TaxID=1872578 RepID=UPI0024897795|nr:dienelactone hydrolase [Aquabacterium sp.]MDI1260280.1 dienelactone hydrolase [Aquabacterium sp.]